MFGAERESQGILEGYEAPGMTGLNQRWNEAMSKRKECRQPGIEDPASMKDSLVVVVILGQVVQLGINMRLG